MHISRIQIQNIRGFDEVDLDLRRPDGALAGWTVLAGRNGSGKSTLLRAVALAIAGREVANKLVKSFKGWTRTGNDLATIRLRMTSPERNSFKAGLAWKTVLLKDQPPGEPALGEYPGGDEESRLEGAWLREEGPWSERRGWFFAGYGPFRRLTGHARDAQELMAGPDRVARLVSLFRDEASLIEVVEWLTQVYLRRLEERPGAAELEEGVLRLLNDGLLPDGARVEKIDSDGLWVEQHGTLLPLESLSDGYRTVAALVMDIVRHLHRAFGNLDLREVSNGADSHLEIRHPGVVLIDEMEEHLHVSWQQRIGFWLKRHFPNIQFLVTTHSPFICQAADPRGLIRLPAPGESRPAEHVPDSLYHTVVNGSADDAVISELFGLESPYSEQSEELRHQVAKLEAALQTGELGEADRSKLEELRSRLPQTQETDVELAMKALAVKL
jgi:energy-coupling factor transporter ATP-binding protein EcfA2